MPTCPGNLLTLEQVAKQMLDNNAYEYEKITSPELISKISNFLTSIPGLEPITKNIDTLVVYASPTVSYLFEFVKGCSGGYYMLQNEFASKLLNLIGVTL